MDSKGFGYCGLACDYCDDNLGCVGCKKGGCPEKDSCKNYQCCITKGYNFCFECPEFPCEDSILKKLRVRTFCKYIKIYGENNLRNRLTLNHQQGIVYHHHNSHIGDYDQFEREEDIIDLINTGRK